MAPEDQIDPFSPFTQIIEIEGVARTDFSECSGLTNGPEPIDYRSVSNHPVQNKRSGLRNFAHVTLKRGVMQG